MADNVTLNTGSGGDTIAADDIGGVKVQRVKVQHGADGSATDVSTASPLPTYRGGFSTSTDVTLASSTSSAQVIASNTARRGMTLTNTDRYTAYLYYGTTASATKFTTKVPSGATWEMPMPPYLGRIDAIWVGNGSGSLIGTELS